MALTFAQAREQIPEPTFSEGYEDAFDYNVLLTEPLWDQVTLVDKETGKVRKAVYFEVEDKLATMTPVSA